MCPGHPIGEGVIVCRKCEKQFFASASEDEIEQFDLCTCDGDKYRYLRADRWEKVEE